SSSIHSFNSKILVATKHPSTLTPPSICNFWSMSNSDSASIATHAQTIGIIHPPPDIKNIVDKTVSFVAKHGPEFEKRIIGRNAGNPKFNFLNGSDLYHAYYQHRLAEFHAQDQAPWQQSSDALEPESNPNDKTDQSAMFRPVKKVLDPPEREQYTIQLPEGITGEELDIIKLTAQLVARNGKSYLTGLTSRENNNPQFQFLKPYHSMFILFTSLVDAYSKVLMPPKELNDKLKKSVTDMTTVLERCLHRLEWEWSQEQARQKAEDEIEQERLLMSMIDWHDFVVVESIDFADDEDHYLPPLMTLEEVIMRSKKLAAVDEEIVEPRKEVEVEMEMDEEEMQLVQAGMKVAALEENNDVNTFKEESKPQMKIVKNYKRPEERLTAAGRTLANIVVSPITGELIPVNEMSEHMRISLIDPKYKEQKERMFAKIRETTLAQDDEISRNIVRLARTRPDIFGTTEEEVSNAVKAEVEKINAEQKQQPKQVIWDGHTGSTFRTATQAMSQNAAEDQIDGVIDDRNLPGPAASLPRPGVPSVHPLPPPPGLALNLPHVPHSTRYLNVTHPFPPMPPPIYSQHPPYMMNRLPLPMSCKLQSVSVNFPSLPIPQLPGSQFTPLAPRPFMPQHGMPILPPPMPQGMLPPPPPEEAAPPLPEEREPKRQRLDDSLLVPEDHFLSQHPGPVRISVLVPNVDEGNLRGQILDITVESLSESVGSLKEKIAGEIQLSTNKQKLSGKAGFFKDNLSLAYYNVGEGEMLSLCLRERGGRKRRYDSMVLEKKTVNVVVLLLFGSLQSLLNDSYFFQEEFLTLIKQRLY
ncbi:hypothetical protein M8C21_031773, partial [Ambrosia artemisiifolia]